MITTSKHLLFLYFTFTLYSGYAQELKNKFGEVYYTAALYKTEYHATKGSPYIDEEFTPAKINNIKETKLVRFDAFRDQVEILTKSNSVMILDDSNPYIIKLIDKSKDIYKTKPYLDNKGNLNHSFFKCIFCGDNFELFIKEEKKFYKEVKAQAYRESQPAEFKKERNRFFVNNFHGSEDVLVEVPDRLNKFVDLFAENAKNVKEFIKSQNLDIRKAKDLTLIFQHYIGS